MIQNRSGQAYVFVRHRELAFQASDVDGRTSMKTMSNLSRFSLSFAVGIAAIAVAQSAYARVNDRQDGTYVQDKLPNGVKTGPLSRDANGGGCRYLNGSHKWLPQHALLENQGSIQ